jgi:hypothetical protein
MIYGTIRSKNYGDRDDAMSQSIATAVRWADEGCTDCDLTGSLGDLEAALERQDDDQDNYENAVWSAVEAINHAFARDD